MAFTFQNIRYGWVALASLGVITGTTIYIFNNQRKQVKPEDIIETTLGTVERCLAPNVSVTPLSVVESWVDTNESCEVTNAIGWFIRADMLNQTDSKMKELPPHYTTTRPGFYISNTVGMTVTGIFADMQIGNRTNQFTRTPTNGTNLATYGDYPEQIYKECLEERYKFLWALSNSFQNNMSIYTSGTDHADTGTGWYVHVTWACGSEWYHNAFWGTSLWAGMRSPPSEDEMLNTAAGYWGSHGNFVLINENYDAEIPGYGTATFGAYYAVSARTNYPKGARKIRTVSIGSLDYYIIDEYGGPYFPPPSPPSSYGEVCSQYAEATLEGGTQYKKYHYLGLIPLAEENDMFFGKVVATTTGEGSEIPLDVKDDSYHIYKWDDLPYSPFLAYSNWFHSQLEIMAGDLNVPNVLGTKTMTFNDDIVYPTVCRVQPGGTTNGPFLYCTNKYW